jgi:hypothetical protein
MSVRPLRSSEKALLTRLLSVDFPGRRQLAEQARLVLVEPIDANGSLQFFPSLDTRAEVAKRVPVEAQCKDLDGMMIHALLHVDSGMLSELEIYKDDSSTVQRSPDTEDWEVMVLGR